MNNKAIEELIPDMRSIKETAARFRLPVHLIRQLVIEKKVYAIQAGSKKYFVNQQSMINYLNGDGDLI